MKSMILAAFAVLSLSIGAANAEAARITLRRKTSDQNNWMSDE